MYVFKLTPDARTAVRTLARLLEELTDRRLADMALTVSTPERGEMLAILPFLRPETEIVIGGALAAPSTREAWAATATNGLAVERLTRHGPALGLIASRLAPVDVLPGWSPPLPGQPSKPDATAFVAGSFDVFITARDTDDGSPPPILPAAFTGVALLAPRKDEPQPWRREFQTRAVVAGDDGLIALDQGLSAAAWTRSEVAWRMSVDDLRDGRDALLDPLLTTTPAFPRERKTFAVRGAGIVGASLANLLPDRIETAVETMLFRGLTGSLECVGFGWQAGAERPPYVYWENRIELSVRKKGCTLECELHCRWQDERPLLNAARKRLRAFARSAV